MNKNSKTVIAVAVVIIAAGVGFWSLIGGGGVTPYVGFTEARASSGNVQVMGDVFEGGSQYNPEDGSFTFVITDDTGDKLKIIYSGTKPGNFDQASSVVCIGKYSDDMFYAERLLVKCPSKYQDETLQPGT